MIKTLIIEDEPAIRKEVEWLVDKEEDLEFVGSAGSVAAALELIKSQEVDLVLMDIQLTDGTAFDLLLRLEEVPFRIIFITAYNHYAIKAIKYGALDYLLKPLDEVELQQALDKIRQENIAEKATEQRLQLEVARAQVEKGGEMKEDEVASLDDQVVLHTMEYLKLLQLREIVYCKSEGSYTNFVLADGKEILVSKPLKYYDDLLPEKWFIRPHQSYLVNMFYVDRYLRTGYIYLKNETNIPVSVRKKEVVMQRILKST